MFAMIKIFSERKMDNDKIQQANNSLLFPQSNKDDGNKNIICGFWHYPEVVVALCRGDQKVRALVADESVFKNPQKEEDCFCLLQFQQSV